MNKDWNEAQKLMKQIEENWYSVEERILFILSLIYVRQLSTTKKRRVKENK